MKRFVFPIIVGGFFSACTSEPPIPPRTPSEPVTPRVETIQYEVVKTYPHDPNAFTEGFFFYEGSLYESTGAPDHLPHTRSTIGIVDTVTGQLRIKAELDRNVYFGEGISIAGNNLYWLTYTNQVCFVYDVKTFKRNGQFSYSNAQGWGLTTIDGKLVMSDGTYNLTFIDPETFQPVKTLAVTRDGYGVDHINELEYINGYIYANVWMTHQILKIDPSSGRVVGVLDLTALFNETRRKSSSISEMNGIAYDPLTNRVFVTGKMWPQMYEIRFNW